ncbi:MAG: hypothetical protein JWN48_6065 [Myxococcaceae bacterium]|nr:hypothetical protein [Myxococcaceae bacterium]
MFARRVLTLLALLLSPLCTCFFTLSARADETVVAQADSQLPAPPTTHAAQLTAAPPPAAAVAPDRSAPAATPPSSAAAAPPPSLAVPPEPPATATVLPEPAAAPLPPDTESSAAPVTTGPTVAAADVSPIESKSHRDPMNAFAFGLKVGLASVGTGNVKNPTYVPAIAALPADQLAKYALTGSGCDVIDKRCHTPARRGFNLSLPMQIGGSGVGFRVEPYLTISADARAYGVYTGPTFEFHVAQPLYLGFGLGLKAAYVKVEPWKYAGDVYGRIPLSATWYVLDDLALTFELGFGAGASGYYREVRNIVIPTTGRTVNKKDIAFGFGRIWDLSVGFRFP